MSKQIFLSAVTSEFGKLRQELAGWAQRTNRCHVRHQDEFYQGGVKTLQKLVNEIQSSDVIIHLIGAQPGWCIPQDQAQQFLSTRSDFGHKYPDVVEQAVAAKLPATQWEAWLGLYFNKSVISLEVQTTDVLDELQSTHLQRLAQCDEHPRPVRDRNDVFVEVLGELDGFFSFNDASPSLELERSQQSVLNALVAESEPTTEDILNCLNPSQPVDSIEKYLLLRWANGAAPRAITKAGQLHYQFVPLHITLDLQRLGLQAEAGQRPEEHEYLQSVLHSHDRLHQGWLLVGGPGSGKTKVLEHFEMTRARDALLQIETDTDTPELCIWMHLGDYRSGEQQQQQLPEPDEWLATKWQRSYPELPDLQTLGSRYRLRFIFDGVNEIQPGAGISRRQAEQRWAAWAANTAAHHLPPVFSVRPLEYHDGLRSDSFCVTKIQLQHWQPEQIKSFIEKRQGLGDLPGGNQLVGLWESIEQQLQQDSTLDQFHGLPMNLDHQCELYENLGHLVTLRAELYSGILCLRLNKVQHTLDDHNLLGSVYNVRNLNDGSWRQQLPLVPSVSLLPHLEQLALAMETNTVVSQQLVESTLGASFDAVMQCIEALHLGSIQGQEFKFVHQTWREYFAAAALVKLKPAQWPECGPAAWDNDVATELTKLQPLQRLSEVDYSPWAETVKLMLQFGQPAQRERLLNYLMQQHPALAARAAAPVKDTLQPKSIHHLQHKLLSQSRDVRVDLRQRIDDGLALGELGDPRYELCQGIGEVPYLWPADGYFVSVPVGVYQVGSNDGDSYDNERMADGGVARLNIDAFRLAFAPVTNAEYACFIRAGGYNDERWWPGVANAWWRGDNEQTESIDFYKSLRSAIQEAGSTDAARGYLASRNPDWAVSQIEGLLPLGEMAEEDFKEWLAENFSATEHKLPLTWNDRAFNNPSQPVSGVSWFGARAYCLWFAFVSDKPVRLPTEAEWQAAAASSENHRWPWGDKPQVPQIAENWRCNTEATHVRATTPVGVFPESDRGIDPGLVDMAGNVQEWCSSAWCDSVNPDVVNSMDDVSNADRVVRGGSWGDDAAHCCAAYRLGGGAVNRYRNQGFRVGLFPVLRAQQNHQQE